MYKTNFRENAVEIEYKLDKQPVNLYNYHNLSRLAALFNYIITDTRTHTSVDDVFERFISATTPISVMKTFVDSFEDFFYLYINARFTHITHVCYNSTKNPIHDNLPIYCFMHSGILIVSYSADYLTHLVNKTSTFNFLFGKANVFIRSTAEERNVSGNEGIHENERILNKTIDQISLKLRANNNEKREKSCHFTLDRVNDIPTIGYKDYSTLDFIQSFEDVYKNGDNNYILGNVYPIQTNIGKIFTEKNRLHLTNLSIINCILETAIATVLEELTKEQIDKPKIKIKFCSNPNRKEATLLTYKNIKLRNGIHAS